MATNIGLIGLGVMGQNLAQNLIRNGFALSVFDRNAALLDKFLESNRDKRVYIAATPAEFIQSLERPRKIILLVKAGEAVDWTIALIKPYLDRDDIIIDCGNSFFKDTVRRQQQLQTDGLVLIGSGTSGGEKGALLGPSLMPGGDALAYEHIRPIWEAIAAKIEGVPCVTYIGPGGSGHFVKMVHNGIEYGDMQLIAETYDFLRSVLRFSAEEIADTFEEWDGGVMESYLIQITAKILRVVDRDTGKPLVDLIRDTAGQKGTGRWTSLAALELNVPIPTIDAAIVARTMSAKKELRASASRQFRPKQTQFSGDKRAVVAALHDALFASKICSYAQGMNLLEAGSRKWNWNLGLGEIARIWQGGCIIRARVLKSIEDAFKPQRDLQHLLLDPHFAGHINKAQRQWRSAIALAQQHGVPVLAMSSSLAYFDTLRAARLPLNLTQAQRDFFGSHTYERSDKPESGFIHTDWEP